MFGSLIYPQCLTLKKYASNRKAQITFMEVFNEMGKYFLNYIKKKINKQNHGVYTGGKARRNYMQVLSPVAKLCVVLHVHFLMFFSKVIYQLQ